jgi:serine/threonine protein kinase
MSTQPPFYVIGKYRVEAMIGQGSMGVVYKGFDPDIERPVAIKMLHTRLVSPGEESRRLARFRQEAQAAARCLHSNIVTVFDYGVVGHSPYMVMEFVDGIDLRSFLREAVILTFKQMMNLVIQVLEALDYAHRQGVVHRDIKPANILLLDSGQVKVTDFGVAKLDTSELTHVGDVIGTPSYMSPEALRGEIVDGRSDLYSTGVVLLELLSRDRPQKKSATWEEAEIAEAVQHSHCLLPSLDAELTRIIKRALASDPAQRYATGQDFAVELKALSSSKQVYVLEQNDLAATVLQSKQTSALRRSARSAPTGGMGSQVSLSPEISQILSQNLARFLGPIASHMIRATASQSVNLQDMIERLSRRIPSDEERRDFINSLNRIGIHGLRVDTSGSGSGTPRTGGTSTPQTPSLGLSQESVQKLTQLLAFHVGPLASRIVRKSLQGARNLDELYQALAENIPEASERTQFLTKARSH